CGLSILIVSEKALAQDTIRTYHVENPTRVKEIFTKINGKANGEVRLFDLDGNLVQIGQLKDDQRHGTFVDLDPETGDTVRVMQFVTNNRQGKSISYFPGGAISQESYFENNQLEGLVTSYFENGKISKKSTFQNNKPNGLTETFFPDGNTESKINFSAGR
ncbi:MAG: hypothetical protein B7Z16_06670, partial [Algoriphagus sp. 32-45-6]